MILDVQYQAGECLPVSVKSLAGSDLPVLAQSAAKSIFFAPMAILLDRRQAQ
jgi:hypothetical protein